MAKHPFHFVAIVSLFLLVSGAARSSFADEPGGGDEPYRVWIEDYPVDADEDLQFAVDSDFDDFYFVQDTGTDSTATTRSRSRSERANRFAQNRRLNNLPNMHGDFFPGSLLQAGLFGTPTIIQQMITDGQNGVNFFVTNANGGAGADPNPAVVILIQNGVTPTPMSIGPGTPQGPPDNLVAYPISDPTSPNFQPPAVSGPGILVYDGGTGTGPIGDGNGWVLDVQHTFIPIQGSVPVPSGGVAVRRFKLSENNSPIPRDRFIANYNFFNDVIAGIGDVNRYAFGFEKTFFNGRSSIEVLFPFASTLAADQVANGTIAKNTQFGDIPIILKTILAERDEYVFAGGMGVTIPTGSDARLFNTDGDELVHLDHGAVHMLPYLALARVYESGWYWQSFLQLDVDVNGNDVRADLSGANLQPVGVLQEQTLFFADLGVGCQLTDLRDGCPLAIAATAELHYASPLQDSDSITVGSLDLRNVVNRFDVLNLTFGMNFLTNRNVSIRPAMVIPLNDDQFDYEAMVQANVFR